MCVQSSSMTLHRIDFIDPAWNTLTIQDVSKYVSLGQREAWDTNWCYLFHSDAVYYATDSQAALPGKTVIRRMDVYWRIDSLANVSAVSVAVPGVAVHLYANSLNSWNIRPDDALTKAKTQKLQDIKLGLYRSTTFQNHSSTIFFTPTKYRAIKPKDVTSVLGFDTSYEDLVTIETVQHTWPLHANNVNLTRGDYHGLFMLQLASSHMEVQTEQRQHTTLAALALAGGSYGLLTTLYILLFGMTRLTPWGLIHHVPVLVSRGKGKFQCGNLADTASDRTDDRSTSSKGSSSIPWFFRRHLFGRYKSSDSAEMIPMERKSTFRDNVPAFNGGQAAVSADNRSQSFIMQSLPLADNCSDVDPKGEMVTQAMISQDRAVSLEGRIEELEMFLREYFLNTEYLDHLRRRRLRRQTTLQMAEEQNHATVIDNMGVLERQPHHDYPHHLQSEAVADVPESNIPYTKF
ncbi:uncharacterized protein BYT42DRAFT_551935 [Radiomyces spectabilis]|uniref:uncharacterized protein n=1 Tax=Radiomyces spectabilis TaxID=64574 RepID=UPI0022204BD6|nr:uncharacterized protein BYT42DRAFT_551935 [Radiomyces spectabilis]KAI8393698.1 hypothetical protein BYT42DRAFT_551935 [Radiomyces spectabilis]